MSYCNKNFEEIKSILLENRNIELLDNQFYSNEIYRLILFGRDDKQEFTILIYQISGEDGQLCQKKLKSIKEKAKVFKKTQHKNIITLIEEFVVGDLYFMLLEKCEQSLYNWQLVHANQEITNSTFKSFAIQMLEGLEYLHENQYFLKNPSLKNIFLDKESNIKFIDFECKTELDENQRLQYLQLSDVDRIKFIPPEDLEISDEDESPLFKINYSVKGDIWSIFMCLYGLSGAKSTHCYYFTLGKETFKDQYLINYRFNMILEQALQRNPLQRPSIKELVSLIQRVDTQVNQMEQKESENELSMFKQAEEFFENQKYVESLSLFKQLIYQRPNSDKYLAWIGRCYCARNCIDESEYWSNSSLLQNPKNDLAYFNLGNNYKIRKESEKAIECYLKSIECNPTNTFSMNNLGLLYDQLLKYEQAQQIYLKAIELQPEKAFLLYNIGRSYFLDKKYSVATKWLKETLIKDPKYYKALTYLGEIAVEENKQDEAIMYYKESLEINPKYESSLYSLGTVYYLKGQYSLSSTYFKRAERQIKTNSVFYILGSSYYCQRKYDKAISYYKKAINLKFNDNNSIVYMKYSKKYL